jgi:hypothetical protein
MEFVYTFILLQDAGKKIKQQVNITINSKMRQSVVGGTSRETQTKKRVSSSLIAEDSQLPRKNRRLEPQQPALPAGEAADSASFSQAQDVQVELKPLSHDEVLEVNSVADAESAKEIKNEEIIVLDSSDCVSSSVYDEHLESLKERQKSLTSKLDDTAATSTLKTEAVLKKCSIVLHDVAVKCTGAVEPVKPISNLPVREADSFANHAPQANKSYIHSSPDVFSGTNGNKHSTVRSNSHHGEKEAKVSPCGTESYAAMISEEVQEKSSEACVNEGGEVGPNVTGTNDSEELLRNDISAKVVHQPNSATKAVPEQPAVSLSRTGLRSSASKMVTTPQKAVFRYTLLMSDFLYL